MKIKLTTIREFPAQHYDIWAEAIRPGLPWLRKNHLRAVGKQEYSSTEHIGAEVMTRATTTVEIIEFD